ncbi:MULTISPECIES: hypothetical protein [unclassified Mycobacterium]|uniref:hypothetical protein n=1 Tax=unclassified Mycobacterium TaxID=2642494 RepID=UPI0008004008|nr:MULTISPECIES: hypothetical protein [unclassified Mycobacterium]OBH07480.1 hypothetical protein A5696_22660 [Mycobacterium sp. E2699]OBI53161.1 hypothetical protein A5705_04330 [Mycobacterium sp. E787]
MEFDSPGVYRVSDQLDAAAELLDRAVGDHLARLAFGAASAGRAHTARGDALRVQLDRLTAEVTQWSRAATAAAAALRAGADRYADAELYTAARIA